MYMMQRWAFLDRLSMGRHVWVVEMSHRRCQNHTRTWWLEGAEDGTRSGISIKACFSVSEPTRLVPKRGRGT